MLSEYEPFLLLESAQTPYHTTVVSPISTPVSVGVGVVVVLIVYPGAIERPENVDRLGFVKLVVGPAPKPPWASTRNPHVLVVRAVGATNVPFVDGIELDPLLRLVWEVVALS
jgi:hypothetical protein